MDILVKYLFMVLIPLVYGLCMAQGMMVVPYLTLNFVTISMNGTNIPRQRIFTDGLSTVKNALLPPRNGVFGTLVDFGPLNNTMASNPHPSQPFIAVVGYCKSMNQDVLSSVLVRSPAAVLLHSYMCTADDKPQPDLITLPSSPPQMNVAASTSSSTQLCALLMDDIVASAVLALISTNGTNIPSGTIGGIPSKNEMPNGPSDRITNSVSIGLIIVYSIIVGAVLVGLIYMCIYIAKCRRRQASSNGTTPMNTPTRENRAFADLERARHEEATRLGQTFDTLSPLEWRKKRIETLPIVVYNHKVNTYEPVKQEDKLTARKDSACSELLGYANDMAEGVTHHDEGEEEPDEETYQHDACCICLEEYEDGVKLRQLVCDHIFHPHCIDAWLCRDSPLCPLCKKDTLTPRRSTIFSPSQPTSPYPLYSPPRHSHLHDATSRTGHYLPGHGHGVIPSVFSYTVTPHEMAQNDTLASHASVASLPTSGSMTPILPSQQMNVSRNGLSIDTIRSQMNSRHSSSNGHIVFPRSRWRAYIASVRNERRAASSGRETRGGGLRHSV